MIFARYDNCFTFLPLGALQPYPQRSAKERTNRRSAMRFQRNRQFDGLEVERLGVLVKIVRFRTPIATRLRATSS